jgi:hypothetical protein
MKNTNQLSLSLFNSVIGIGEGKLSIDYTNGIITEGGAAHAKSDIVKFVKDSKLNGQDLNKTFHKSWKVIKESSREDLFIHQITHYLSTYGSNFEGEIYIPDEVLDVPDTKLKFKVIKALSKKELTQKCLDILKSGIALKEETLSDVFQLIENLGYNFTGQEEIRNKEAVILIADKYGIYPTNPVEFLRYIVYKSTDSTLLIKDKDTFEKIKLSRYDPSYAFNSYGLDKLASIFNRFKPIFLSYKRKCPTVINKISKLSKVEHKPFIQSKLNLVTSEVLVDTKCLEKATVFALFKALNACYSRMNGQDTFTYRIRNGKSFTKENNTNVSICKKNYKVILNFIKNKLPQDKSVFIPKNVTYALPTSEKMFVGNVPTGTRIASKKLNVGIYWENSWGANDLDLSSIDVSGTKVGWNANYNHNNVYYSGDITSAPDGAVEFLRFNKPEGRHIVKFNVFSGKENCDYKIVLGKGEKVDREYMMNPNKVLFETKCTSPQRQTSIGTVHAEGGKSVFTFLNFGSGNLNVSGGGELSKLRINSIFQQWDNSISFNKLASELGWNITKEQDEADIDLSLDNLDKDSFIRIFD